MKMYRTLAALSVLPLLGGCAATVTPYERPEMPVKAAWATITAAPASDMPDAWWTAFGDTPLNALVDRVLARNANLAAAALRLQRARLQSGLAENALMPQPSGSGSASASRPFDGGPTTRRLGLTGSVSYELDLFNRLGSLRDAAQWEVRATGEDIQAARLALIGTTATLYFQRQQLLAQLELADASLAYARRTLTLVEAQREAGAVSALERAEALRSVETQEAARTQVVQQAMETENALTVLLDGERPAVTGSFLAGIALPGVDAGVPASLLSRRPDLRAAEARLRASMANADAVDASFYPGFALTASAGTSSSALKDLLSNPVGTVAGTIALPFLNIRQAKLSRGISRLQLQENAASFRQTYRQALAKVENLLSARIQLDLQGGRLDLALALSRQAEGLYETRYRSGAVALRDWLAAQDARRQAEAAVMDNRLARLSNHIRLMQALGGGLTAAGKG